MHWARAIGMLDEGTLPVKKSVFLVRRKWGLFSNSLFANQCIYWITSLLHYDAFGVYNLIVLFILSMFLNERVLYKIMGSVREKEAHPLHIMFWGQRRKLAAGWEARPKEIATSVPLAMGLIWLLFTTTIPFPYLPVVLSIHTFNSAIRNNLQFPKSPSYL